MKRIIVSADSNVGYVRTNNEDMVLVGSKKVRDGDCYATLDMDAGTVIVAVADGMGGYESGEVASEMVIDSLSFYVNDLPAGLDEAQFRQAMDDWLASESRKMEVASCTDQSKKNMGTTLVALVCYGGDFYILNCGDSRLYFMRDGVLTQLTRDHTPEMQYGHYHRSHSVTNCIGGGCVSSYFDISNITDFVMPDDLFMLCSDGLTDMIEDVTIASVMRMNEGVVNASPLVKSALDAGGGDNVSVCLAKYECIDD